MCKEFYMNMNEYEYLLRVGGSWRWQEGGERLRLLLNDID